MGIWLEVGRRFASWASLGQQFVIRQGPSFYVVPNCQAKVATTVTM